MSIQPSANQTGRRDNGAAAVLALPISGKPSSTGLGDAGDQKIDDLDVIGQPEAEARLVLFVEGGEKPRHLIVAESLDIGRDFDLVILTEIPHLDTASDDDVFVSLGCKIGEAFVDQRRHRPSCTLAIEEA